MCVCAHSMQNELLSGPVIFPLWPTLAGITFFFLFFPCNNLRQLRISALVRVVGGFSSCNVHFETRLKYSQHEMRSSSWWCYQRPQSDTRHRTTTRLDSRIAFRYLPNTVCTWSFLSSSKVLVVVAYANGPRHDDDESEVYFEKLYTYICNKRGNFTPTKRGMNALEYNIWKCFSFCCNQKPNWLTDQDERDWR